jgi:hypothetical protein
MTIRPLVLAAALAALAAPAAAASFDAVSVRSNATIASRTANVVGAVSRGLGIVEVRMAVATARCIATATPKVTGDPLDFDVPVGRTPFFTQVVYTPSSSSLPGVSLAKSLFVITHKKDGTRAATGFDLHVMCP